MINLLIKKNPKRASTVYPKNYLSFIYVILKLKKFRKKTFIISNTFDALCHLSCCAEIYIIFVCYLLSYHEKVDISPIYFYTKDINIKAKNLIKI